MSDNDWGGTSSPDHNFRTYQQFKLWLYKGHIIKLSYSTAELPDGRTVNLYRIKGPVTKTALEKPLLWTRDGVRLYIDKKMERK